MKAKLIKDNDGYWLDISDDGITKRPLSDFGQLSTKNCEAIANGYDLDELANDHWDGDRQLNDPKSFRDGFQKALEILGDKKFSEEDIYRAFEEGERQDRTGLYDIIRPTEQTEWDVEIVMIHGFDDINDPKPFSSPKLDADGCLILRRK
jgi:hypothetical protein